MKKTTKDKEIEKLKKQVEKLKSEKESLKRDKRSLIGKLATAQAKADKYHDALKKDDTERCVGQGGLRFNDEPIGRHQYSTLMVALSVAFYTRLSVGSRQVVEIFNILTNSWVACLERFRHIHPLVTGLRS